MSTDELATRKGYLAVKPVHISPLLVRVLTEMVEKALDTAIDLREAGDVKCDATDRNCCGAQTRRECPDSPVRSTARSGTRH